LWHSFRRRRLRSSHPTQLAAAKAIFDARDAMIPEWADWLMERPGSSSIPRPVVERQARLVLDTLIEMLGPLRREAKQVWQQVSEHYGRMAAARGLAAGEVVEELQHLRLLLIKHIGALIAVMRPRRAVAVFLRLNGIIDRCIAQAVVGYTDALVASLLMTDRQTQPLTETSAEDSVRQLEGLEQQLAAITSRR
jgi:phosphoglycolate phosphatase-like HAD superfamily hydrolase